MTPPPLQHGGDLLLHAQEHAAQVHGHQAVPLVFGHVDDRLHRLFDARIVEGEIEPAERLDRLRDGGFDFVGAGHVTDQCNRLPADFADELCCLFHLLGQMADDRDARAALGERQSGHSPDPAAASGDEGGLAAEWLVSLMSGPAFVFLVVCHEPYVRAALCFD